MAGKKQKPYRLLVVAHPDDEALWFTGLVLQKRKSPWKLIIVTDANADGMGAERVKQGRESAKRLKIKDVEFWDQPDIYAQRLNVDHLQERLSALPKPKEVFTHSLVGDYGHPHHQDVSYAVHQVFPKTWSVAYNCFPQKKIMLTSAQFKIKRDIIGQVYQSETNRFLNFLPCQATEFFCQTGDKESQLLYHYFTQGIEPDLKKLKTYAWLWPYIQSNLNGIPERKF